MSDVSITALNLHKSFGNVHAVRGVDLVVPRGTVFGLLGPNGAGKTTVIRMLTTLLIPDSGEAKIEGFDVVRDAGRVREVIGLAGQSAAVDENLTGRENLVMVGRLYHMPRPAAQKRASELLAQLDLTDAADRTLKTYSGGMRRRLDLAASLVNHPPVLFLDEPTTGLDPQSRIALWRIIRALVAEGTTVVLTTQYLEEADHLADTIVVIDHGKIIASGTPRELKSQVGVDVMEVRLEDGASIERAAAALNVLGDVKIDRDLNLLSLSLEEGSGKLVKAIRALDAGHIKIDDLVLRHPTLDEVFLKLTGHTARN